KEKKLIVSYDEALQTYIVDEDKLIEEIKKYLKNEKNYVIDGNFSHLIPSDIYIVIRTDPNILYSRLLQRGYSYNKIFENIWAMNLEVIEEEIENMGKEYYVFNNNTENDIEIIVNSIIEIINKNKIIL
ncbi:MAG: AAA family ATPase, partial [Nanopusillaceae archaeon]